MLSRSNCACQDNLRVDGVYAAILSVDAYSRVGRVTIKGALALTVSPTKSQPLHQE